MNKKNSILLFNKCGFRNGYLNNSGRSRRGLVLHKIMDLALYKKEKVSFYVRYSERYR